VLDHTPHLRNLVGRGVSLIDRGVIDGCQWRMYPPLVTVTRYSAGTIRKRRLRSRARRGLVVLRVEIDHDRLVEAQLISGRLSERDALDRRRVEADVAEIVNEWAARWLK
jgi:hypothetical protein